MEEREKKTLNITASGRDLEISNSVIQLRMVLRDGGYAQEYYAADSKGQSQLLLTSLSRNLIVSSEHRECSSPMIAGHRPHLFGVCHDSLRMAYSKADIVYRDTEKAVARLTGSVQGHNLTCDITIQAGSNVAHVVVTDEIDRSHTVPVLEYLMSSYAFTPGGRMVDSPQNADYTWVPNLRPASDCVIGDCAFYSPAAIIQYGPNAVSMIPDLEILNANRVMPAVLDMDFSNGLLFSPLLSYGFCGYEPTEDGRCSRHDITLSRRLSDLRLTYGYYLILDATCKRKSAYKQAARFLWEKSRVYTPKPLISSSQPAAAACPPDARIAYGLYANGVHHGDKDAAARARKMIDTILSAPQNEGLFPTQYDPIRGEWSGCRTLADGGYYSTTECSQQLYWLLKWHSEVQTDPRIISYCRKYADFIISGRLRSGAIPSWYTVDRVPLSALRSSAQTAASVLFLAKLAQVTKLKAYTHAAEASAKYIINEIAYRDLYVDYTCLDPVRRSTIEFADPHSGVQPQSSYSMLWAAQMCIELYSSTANRTYLREGADILDKLCLFQSVISRPWAQDGSALGLLKTGNIGSGCDVELTAEFGRCAMQYGAATGEREYFERGTAAIYAAISSDIAADETRARIAGSAVAIRKEFGSAYVHVGKKWAAGTLEHQVRRLDIQSGSISIELAGHTNGSNMNRLVFGGLRRSAYKARINGQSESYSRSDLERGIPIPAPDTEMPDLSKARQTGLFD